ncbi:aminoadipate-semialdehyde dehydrogenase isoform X2 [Xylocopa sonorina]
MISDQLKCIKNIGFIGINFDVPKYCVISLMLGILYSEQSFINIPSNVSEFMNFKDRLSIHYLFCKNVSIEGDIVYRFTVHGECIYLIKLKNTRNELVQNVKPNHYAYAISTSGSTGTPKVVRVLHSCIIPNILDLTKILAITKHDKISQFTNFTFDPSLIEIFLALSNAATLFMVSQSLKKNPSRLLNEAYSNQITILQMTPSVFIYNWTTESLKTSILSNNTSLRVILFGGEPFPKLELLSEMKQPYNDTKIYNIYGITEMSCWASINEIIVTDGQSNVHYLGQPLSHTIFQVRDKSGEIISNGTGCLYIGSNQRICVINDEVLEELQLPVFRDSGDIVGIDEEGRIFYKGRKNSVIKRFGNKVDLQKLEESVLQIDFVKSCYILWDDSHHHLHLCFSTKENVKSDENVNMDIMKHLHELDSLYRPDKIHFLKHVEFTSSGKISLQFLKERYMKDQGRKGILNDIDVQRIESDFKSIWRNNLQRENDGFVKLGGTSIIALQISNTMSEMMNIEFPELIGMLLMNATVDKCLSYIKDIISSNDRERSINAKSKPFTTTITIEYTESSKDSAIEKQNCDSTILTNKICACEWYKCRGQTYGNMLSMNKKHELKYDEISKVTVLKAYDLYKCVDASPTLFHYSDGKTYATVGSHSGFVLTFELGEKSKSAFRIKLPDRIEASVLVLENFRGVVGCYDGKVYCFHLKTGTIIWAYQTEDVVKCSAIFCKEKEIIILGSYDSYIYCLSAKDGSEVWKFKSGNGSISASGCLHFSSDTVLFGTLNGLCLALQKSSGKVVWKHKLSDPIFVAPSSLSNGLVLFCSVTGLLICFDIEVNVKMWVYKINGNIFSYIIKQIDSSEKYENIILASQNKNVYCLQSEDTNFRTEPTLKYVLNFHSPILATPWCENNFLFIACTDGTLNIYNVIKDRLMKIEKLPGEVFSSPVVDKNVVIVGCRDNNVYVLELA